ncbi:DUF5343 domain-containing protein [Frankia sp. RB7]|nr:DUF5343 domain-containing protein [Frankia sp. RB7]
MDNKLPYLHVPGSLPKILTKITEVRRPDRFTQDYLETIIGFRGGNYRAIIPLLKRMEFLNGDGSPTTLFDQYRNDDTRAIALATGVRNAFSAIFDRNQFAYALPRDTLASLVTEISGLPKSNSVAKLIVSTFWTLKDGANFESKDEREVVVVEKKTSDHDSPPPPPPPRTDDEVQFRVGYTINLNLPETTNPEVFNAIFKALKEHLLRN